MTIETSPDGDSRPAQSAPERGRGRRWMLGLGLALGGTAALVVAAILILAFLAPARAPQESVAGYDRAFDDADCALYTRVTTDSYREGFLPTCDDFVAAARDFAEGYSEYDIVFTDTLVDGDRAVVKTSESYTIEGETGADRVVYTLVRVGGTWRIDEVAEG